MNSANDIQIAGTHYRAKVQHWDFASANYGPGYLKGCATKYLSRYRKKNGLEDLQKARHYVQKLIEVDWVQLGWGLESKVTVLVSDFGLANDMTATEARAVTLISGCAIKGYQEALEILDALISTYSER